MDVLQLVEYSATALSVVYVVLAAKQSQWCWPAAFISTALYTYLFWEVSLLSESLLNAYYLIMAVWGFIAWRSNRTEKHLNTSERPLKWHLIAILSCGLGSILWGHFMASFTQAAMPYLDATTTVFAIFATWMLTRRILENWLYFIVIDIVSIYMYMNKSLYSVSALMLVYTVMAVYGYFEWKKSDAEQRTGQ